MFNSVKEFALALTEDRKFIFTSHGTDYICLMADPTSHGKTGFIYCLADLYPNIGMAAPMGPNQWDQYATVKEYTQPVWYENIPEQGILCNTNPDPKTITPNNIAVIVEYSPHETFPYRERDRRHYKYATPLTLEQLEQFVYKPPKA